MGVITERERQKYFTYLDGVADGLNESINGIEKRILPIYDNDADHQALVTAIDTMRKYKEIKKLVKEWWQDDGDPLDAMLEIKKVVEDGNVD